MTQCGRSMDGCSQFECFIINTKSWQFQLLRKMFLFRRISVYKCKMYLQQIYPTGGVPNLNVSAEKQELKILKRLRSGLQTFKGSPSPLSETFRYKRFLYIFPQKSWIFLTRKKHSVKKCKLDLFSPVFL